MDFFETIRARHSIRGFRPDSVEKEKLQAILEAINGAPSAGNKQAYEVFVVTDRQALAALSLAAGGQKYVAEAAVALVFCTNPRRNSDKYGVRGAELYSVQDATIACTYAQLAATALRLASVWIGAFADDAVRQVIGVDGSLRPVAVLPIGYAGKDPENRPRRVLTDLVKYV